jgi:hypothetical protein
MRSLLGIPSMEGLGVLLEHSGLCPGFVIGANVFIPCAESSCGALYNAAIEGTNSVRSFVVTSCALTSNRASAGD